MATSSELVARIAVKGCMIDILDHLQSIHPAPSGSFWVYVVHRDHTVEFPGPIEIKIISLHEFETSIKSPVPFIAEYLDVRTTYLDSEVIDYEFSNPYGGNENCICLRQNDRTLSYDDLDCIYHFSVAHWKGILGN